MGREKVSQMDYVYLIFGHVMCVSADEYKKNFGNQTWEQF